MTERTPERRFVLRVAACTIVAVVVVCSTILHATGWWVIVAVVLEVVAYFICIGSILDQLEYDYFDCTIQHRHKIGSAIDRMNS